MAIATTNPATGQVIKTFEPLTDAQIAEFSSRIVTALEEQMGAALRTS